MLLQLAIFHSFLWLNNIPLCVLIWFSIEWHLDCFSADVNSAATNIRVHLSFQISIFFFFPDTYPGVELLDHVVVLFLVS